MTKQEKILSQIIELKFEATENKINAKNRYQEALLRGELVAYQKIIKLLKEK